MFKITKNRNLIILFFFLSVILTPIISYSEIIFEVEDFFADNDPTHRYFGPIIHNPVDFNGDLIGNKHSLYRIVALDGIFIYQDIKIPGIKVNKIVGLDPLYLIVGTNQGLFLLDGNMIINHDLYTYFNVSEKKTLNKIIYPIYSGRVTDIQFPTGCGINDTFFFCSENKIIKAHYDFTKTTKRNIQDNFEIIYEGKQFIYNFTIEPPEIFIGFYPKGFELRKFNVRDNTIGKRLYRNRNILLKSSDREKSVSPFTGKRFYRNMDVLLKSGSRVKSRDPFTIITPDNEVYELKIYPFFSSLKKEKRRIPKFNYEYWSFSDQDFKNNSKYFPYGDIYSLSYNEKSFIGTWGNGIFITENPMMSHLFDDEIITGIIHYKDKIIYSTWDGKIGILNKKLEKDFKDKNKIKLIYKGENNYSFYADPPIHLMENIYHLKLGHHDNLYICGKGTIKVVNLKNTKFNNSEFQDGLELNIPEAMKDTEFLSLGEYYSEEGYLHIFAGTFQNGLLHYIITHNDKHHYHILKDESIPIIEDSYNKIFISTGEKIYYFNEIFKRLDVPDNGKVTDIKYISGDFKRVLGKEMNEFKGDEKKYLVISTEKKGITIYDLITDEQLILPIFATKLAIEKNEERKNWERRPFISSKSHPKSLMIIPDKPLFKIIAAEEFANEIRVWKIGIY